MLLNNYLNYITLLANCNTLQTCLYPVFTRLNLSLIHILKKTADGKQESDHTAASWKAFQDAYEAAKTLPETTQTEIAEKTKAISDALSLLACLLYTSRSPL